MIQKQLFLTALPAWLLETLKSHSRQLAALELARQLERSREARLRQFDGHEWRPASRYVAAWQARWSRPPTEQELDGLIKRFIRESIYYREAVAMGLDQGDPVTRRRMAQKLEFLTRDIAFFRTPKHAKAHGLVRALLDAREELLFLAVLLLAAWAVLLREDGALLDVRVWSLLLLIQGVPYAAAGLLSLISAAPRLPGRLVGNMRRLQHPRLA